MDARFPTDRGPVQTVLLARRRAWRELVVRVGRGREGKHFRLPCRWMSAHWKGAGEFHIVLRGTTRNSFLSLTSDLLDLQLP